MPRPPRYTAIVFDLGDVLFHWSAETSTSIPPRTLRAILDSLTWHNYERGRLGEAECYASIGTEFNVSPEEVRQAFRDARDSLQINNELVEFIRELKAKSEGQLRIYAMSNISLPDLESVRTIMSVANWLVFDQIFTSGETGERKPNLNFYRHVISTAGLEPSRTIFVDDKIENVVSARSLGFCGVVFDNAVNIKRALRNLTRDPVQQGQGYLNDNAGKLDSITKATPKKAETIVKENITQLLILEATEEK